MLMVSAISSLTTTVVSDLLEIEDILLKLELSDTRRMACRCLYLSPVAARRRIHRYNALTFIAYSSKPSPSSI
jgi:hypothetical protein